MLWTHNDSGDQPRLYAIDTTAALMATIDVSGAWARDWEAMDIGPCPGTEAPLESWCLYVADTGDNGRRHESVAIYVVPEPDPRRGSESTEVLGVFLFTYEGGARDVEALAVSPRGDVALVTKGRDGRMSVFHVDPLTFTTALGVQSVRRLTSHNALPISPDFSVGRWLTGGSFNANGSVLALRTYAEVYFYQWPMPSAPFEPVEAAPACFLGLIEPSGEAIAFDGADRLFLSSESPGPFEGHLLSIECAGIGAAGQAG